jgi:Uma2 family endonuclease
MTSAIFNDGLPVTEEEFLGLGETARRIELFDGSLFVTPAPTPRHQIISRRLANALDTDPELTVMEAVNVRLRPGRIPIPDIVITSMINIDESIIDADSVRLVGEIVSPSNAAADKVLKMHYYAAAGIPYYLLVDTEAGTLYLFALDGEKYREHAVAKRGEDLRLTEPVTATLVPDDLLPPR